MLCKALVLAVAVAAVCANTECPVGMSFDAETGACTLLRGTRQADNCKPGYKRSDAGVCTPITTTTPSKRPGRQAECEEGYEVNENGECAKTIKRQAECEEGYEVNENGECAKTIKRQAECEEGYEVNENGECVKGKITKRQALTATTCPDDMALAPNKADNGATQACVLKADKEFCESADVGGIMYADRGCVASTAKTPTKRQAAAAAASADAAANTEKTDEEANSDNIVKRDTETLTADSKVVCSNITIAEVSMKLCPGQTVNVKRSTAGTLIEMEGTKDKSENQADTEATKMLTRRQALPNAEFAAFTTKRTTMRPTPATKIAARPGRQVKEEEVTKVPETVTDAFTATE